MSTWLSNQGNLTVNPATVGGVTVNQVIVKAATLNDRRSNDRQIYGLSVGNKLYKPGMLGRDSLIFPSWQSYSFLTARP